MALNIPAELRKREDEAEALSLEIAHSSPKASHFKKAIRLRRLREEIAILRRMRETT